MSKGVVGAVAVADDDVHVDKHHCLPVHSACV